MPDTPASDDLPALPAEILIVTGTAAPPPYDFQPRRGESPFRSLKQTTSVQITEFRTQVNVFLRQMDEVLAKAPAEVGGFELAELEVSAGFIVEGKGNIKLALVASAEIGASVNAGLKFVFRRK